MNNVKVTCATLTILALSACGERHTTGTGDGLGNLVVVCTDRGSKFMNPEDIGPWMFTLQPRRANIGQLNMFCMDKRVYAVTALHVLNLKDFPTSEHLRGWKSAVDGEELSFAEIINWQALGFKTEPKCVKAPTLYAPACMRSTPFINAEEGFCNVEINGVLNIINDPAVIKRVGELLTEKTSFGTRLLMRAPLKPFLGMDVPQECNEALRGSSGALVWQDGFPVGVFVGAFMNTDKPSVVFIEQLLDPAFQTLP